MAKKIDYTKKSIKDLDSIIADAYKTLGNARFGGAGSRANNTDEGRVAKKAIAKAKTELKARELKE